MVGALDTFKGLTYAHQNTSTAVIANRRPRSRSALHHLYSFVLRTYYNQCTPYRGTSWAQRLVSEMLLMKNTKCVSAVTFDIVHFCFNKHRNGKNGNEFINYSITCLYMFFREKNARLKYYKIIMESVGCIMFQIC